MGAGPSTHIEDVRTSGLEVFGGRREDVDKAVEVGLPLLFGLVCSALAEMSTAAS